LAVDFEPVEGTAAAVHRWPAQTESALPHSNMPWIAEKFTIPVATFSAEPTIPDSG